jgi:hypothetical protein
LDGTKSGDGPIDTSSVKADKAFQIFKEYDTKATASGRTQYEILPKTLQSTRWRDSTEEETETPLQKFERLRIEVAQFLTELDALTKQTQQSSAPENSNSTNNSKQSNVKTQPEVNLSQLSAHVRQLHKDLEDALKKEQYQPLLNPEFSLQQSLQLTRQTEVTTKLLHYLQIFANASGNVNTEATPNDGVEPHKRSATSESPSPKSPSIIYEVYYSPEQWKFDALNKIAEIEKKINFLETIIGKQTIPQDPTVVTSPLLTTAKELKEKISHLDENSLTLLEKKIQILSEEMDILLKKRENMLSVTSDEEKKIHELFQCVPKVEAMANELPHIVSRLAALKTLHEEGALLTQVVHEVDSEQANITSLLKRQATLLSEMEANLAKNMTIIQSNFVAMEKRLKDLESKLK